MYCKNCGTLVNEKAGFCANCGTPIPNNQNISKVSKDAALYGYNEQNKVEMQTNEDVVNNPFGPAAQPTQQVPQSPQYNYSVQSNVNNTKPQDKTNVGLCILSVLLPIVGIILYFVRKSESPKEAKGCLLSALISAGVSVLLTIVITIATFGTYGGDNAYFKGE